MKKLFFTTCVSSLLLGLSSVATAQSQSDAPDDCIASGSNRSLDSETNCLTSDNFMGQLNLVAPENALFTLIGAAPENVIKPKLGDKFSFSLLPQAVDSFNNGQFSFGIEANPGQLMLPKEYTMAEFLRGTGATTKLEASNDYLSRERISKIQSAKFWSRFTILGAATRSNEGQEIAKYGAGVSYVFDSGSPFETQGKYGDCMENKEVDKLYEDEFKKWKAARGETPFELSNNFKKKIKTLHDGCFKQINSWNREVFSAGLAIYHSEIGDPNPMLASTLPTSKSTGYGGWVSAALPLGSNGQFTLSGQLTDDLVRERKEEEETITETVDGWRIGSRYTHHITGGKKGNPGRAVRGFFEAAYAEENFGMINDNFTQAGFGVEIQLQDNLFFQATIGDTFGSEIDRSTYLSGQFKWSFSKAAAK